jgi:tellurite resistance protein TehA-like permease
MSSVAAVSLSPVAAAGSSLSQSTANVVIGVVVGIAGAALLVSTVVLVRLFRHRHRQPAGAPEVKESQILPA